MARSKKDAVLTAENDISDEIMPVDDHKVEIVADSAPEVSKTDVKTADEGVAELKKRLEASEENTRRLERERNEAVQRAYAAKNETDDTNVRLIESAYGTLVEQNKLLKREQAAAWAAGDFDRAADLGEVISLNLHKANDLEQGRQSLKDRPKEQPRPLDPVEALAGQLSPRSAAWVRAHPEYATNPRLYQKMIAADNIARADGLKVDSDDYFDSVEDTLKINQRAPTRAVQDDVDDPTYSEASRPTSGRQTSPSAIPVSRDVSTSGTRQRTIRLSAAEAEAAEMSGITHEEYARNRDSMRADRGRMN